METDTNKALAQMMENLTKLESARKQVEKVTASGEALTEQGAALLAETSKLMETLGVNLRELSEQVTEKVTASEAHIHQVTEERSALIGGMLEEMKKTFDATETTVCRAVSEVRVSAEETLLQVAQEQKGQLSNFQTSLDGRLGESLTEFRNKLLQFETSAQKMVRESSIDINRKIEAFAVSAQEMKTTSTSAVKEVTALSVKVLKEQEQEVNALLVQMRDTDEKVRGLLGYIRELDLATKWLSLANEMKIFRQDVEQHLSATEVRLDALQKGQTYLFYALGAIALLLLVLKFV